MIHKLRKSSILIIFFLILMFIVYLASFLMDQSILYDLFFIFWVPATLIIALCDEMGYFNKKIVLMVLVALFVLAWGLISYLPVNPSVDKIQYDEIAGLLTIFFIVIVFWIFRGWDN